MEAFQGHHWEEDGEGNHGGDERVNLMNRFLISSKDLGFPLICISLLAVFRCNKPTCVYTHTHTHIALPLRAALENNLFHLLGLCVAYGQEVPGPC